MYAHRNPKNDDPAPLVADDVYKIIMEVGPVSNNLDLDDHISVFAYPS